jgi:hypothetical protein
VASRDAIGDGQDTLHQPGEVLGGDRPAVDLDAFAVGDEVRLRRRPDVVARCAERGPGDGQDAALAVRPGDQGSTDAPFGVPELAQQRACPPEALPVA